MLTNIKRTIKKRKVEKFLKKNNLENNLAMNIIASFLLAMSDPKMQELFPEWKQAQKEEEAETQEPKVNEGILGEISHSTNDPDPIIIKWERIEIDVDSETGHDPDLYETLPHSGQEDFKANHESNLACMLGDMMDKGYFQKGESEEL